MPHDPLGAGPVDAKTSFAVHRAVLRSFAVRKALMGRRRNSRVDGVSRAAQLLRSAARSLRPPSWFFVSVDETGVTATRRGGGLKNVSGGNGAGNLEEIWRAHDLQTRFPPPGMRVANRTSITTQKKINNIENQLAAGWLIHRTKVPWKKGDRAFSGSIFLE